MRKKIRYLTELDVARLEKSAAEPGAPASREALLDELLQSAEIVESAQIASNVVTMNSQITLVDERTGESLTWTVVYPPRADIGAGRLNVFSPAGIALLGAKRGDTVHFTPPGGSAQTLKIEKVLYQPEAAGDLTL
jgi:regulator of nucleoside diphosphate kinase